MTMLSIRRATEADLPLLREFSERTFRAAFEHRNDPRHFGAYMARAFDPEQFRQEFAHPHSEFWLGWAGELLAAYVKLNLDRTPDELAPARTLEIERIYVHEMCQGRGYGQEMIDFCKRRALENGVGWLWLGVWEENEGAIRFYGKNGFEVFGSHDFWVGEDRQTDLMMRWKAGGM